MRYAARSLALLVLVVLVPEAFSDDNSGKRKAIEALKPFNDLIGSWNGLGVPEGKLQEKQKGAWEETIAWQWQFSDNDAWLKTEFTKGKHFVDGTLRFLPEQKQYQLALTTPEKQTVTFTGAMKEHRLILERQDEKTKERQRMVLSLLYDNRYLYHYEVQPENHPFARKVYLVGATKVGKPLVKESDEIGPYCVVSYGPPLTPVTYQGKTYYIC